MPLPPGYLERSIREQLDVLLSAGLAPLEARLALLPRLWLRSRQELEFINCQGWPAAYRNQKLAESCGFWAELWSLLRYHLERGEAADAEHLLDKALARVEPAPASVGARP